MRRTITFFEDGFFGKRSTNIFITKTWLKWRNFSHRLIDVRDKIWSLLLLSYICINFHISRYIYIIFWFEKPSDEYDLSQWRNDFMSALLATWCCLFLYIWIGRVRNCTIPWRKKRFCFPMFDSHLFVFSPLAKSKCKCFSTQICQWSSSMRRNGTKTSYVQHHT